MEPTEVQGMWTWSEVATGTRGVDLYGDQLVWYHEHWPMMGASDGGAAQTLDEFFANGPMDPRIPPDALAELTDAVRAKLAARRVR